MTLSSGFVTMLQMTLARHHEILSLTNRLGMLSSSTVTEHSTTRYPMRITVYHRNRIGRIVRAASLRSF